MLYQRKLGQGPDLILLHGFAFNQNVWDEVVGDLSSSFTLHLIDLPGHGHSQHVEMPDDIDACIDMLLQVMPEQAHVVGWSLGGLLATKLASQHPQRIRSLTLLASTPCFLEQDGWQGVSQNFFSEFAAKINQNISKALRYFILLGLVDRHLQKQYFKLVNQVAANPSLPQPITLRNALTLLADNDLRDVIKNIECPVKYLLSEHDPLAPLNELANQVVLAAKGHFPQITHPELVIAAIKESVDECSPINV